MKQLFGNLFVSLIAGLWLSLKEVQCKDLDKGIYTLPCCYNTSSGKTCFTTFLANNGRAVRKPFEEASRWCKEHVPGSSMIIINSAESKSTVERFIGRQVLENETIFMDAQRLSGRNSLEWSWVNGNQTIPIDMKKIAEERRPEEEDLKTKLDTRNKSEQFHDGACSVESKHGQSLTYCVGNVSSQYRYICEMFDTKAVFSYRQDNKSYFASEVVATWYDARNECLRLGGDLSSITDLQTIEDWLKEKPTQLYWIGLHRNKWIWKSSGAAITYTNWEGGYPDDTSDKQCICISPLCRRDNEKTITEALNDRKWWSCNCNHSYAIVCHGGITEDTTSISSMTEEAPNNCAFDHQTTVFRSSSSPSSPTAGQQNSSNTKQIIIILLLFVAVVFIIVAVILIIRKRKYNSRNEGSPMKNSKQSEKVSSAYTTVVSDNNRPSESTVPPGTTIYAVVEITVQPMPPSNDTIYASVQPSSEAVDMGKSVDYADLDFPMKDLQKRNSAGKIAACLSQIYSQPFEVTTTSSNSVYAEPFKPEPDKSITATTPVLNHHHAAADQQNVYSLAKAIPLGDPNAIYSEPNKLTKSSEPTGKAVKATDPIYQEAIEVKPGAGSEGVATQDPSAVYAEPIKVKKSP